jgi:hypothetical protein
MTAGSTKKQDRDGLVTRLTELPGLELINTERKID